MDASAIHHMRLKHLEAAVKAQLLWEMTPRQVEKIHKMLFGSADPVMLRKLLERHKEDKE